MKTLLLAATYYVLLRSSTALTHCSWPHFIIGPWPFALGHWGDLGDRDRTVSPFLE
jgi:hypothetical protein